MSSRITSRINKLLHNPQEEFEDIQNNDGRNDSDISIEENLKTQKNQFIFLETLNNESRYANNNAVGLVNSLVERSQQKQQVSQRYQIIGFYKVKKSNINAKDICFFVMHKILRSIVKSLKNVNNQNDNQIGNQNNNQKSQDKDHKDLNHELIWCDFIVCQSDNLAACIIDFRSCITAFNKDFFSDILRIQEYKFAPYYHLACARSSLDNLKMLGRNTQVEIKNLQVYSFFKAYMGDIKIKTLGEFKKFLTEAQETNRKMQQIFDSWSETQNFNKQQQYLKEFQDFYIKKFYGLVDICSVLNGFEQHCIAHKCRKQQKCKQQIQQFQIINNTSISCKDRLQKCQNVQEIWIQLYLLDVEFTQCALLMVSKMNKFTYQELDKGWEKFLKRLNNNEQKVQKIFDIFQSTFKLEEEQNDQRTQGMLIQEENHQPVKWDVDEYIMDDNTLMTPYQFDNNYVFMYGYDNEENNGNQSQYQHDYSDEIEEETNNKNMKKLHISLTPSHQQYESSSRSYISYQW
ncbi:hypothetical protein TTHERM_00075870 (macronuclear) [Tetrahymena thermophila SB210]|uniref:Uncharacterized protein n=1 Tax=Tetrahymena thermophila (strain SB210) TaxID=312017 RepID=Q23G78_TETTS|nr:hypothetical protein TTHERM_00075870 [Tetrahymena thermophila SB210]EAR95382.2 hypothetical protein TTHERM_00075870 [Tetrahymena thermophila SB210]|eukprot:XP_001015627.2 hypothetical protein TTHERM_00075870 [Tetrahymena thermophila SB210]